MARACFQIFASLWLLGAGYCANYELAGKIRAAYDPGTSGESGLALSQVSGGSYDGSKVLYTLSNAIRFSAQIAFDGISTGLAVEQSNIPAYLSVSVSPTGLLQIGTILPASFPSNWTTNFTLNLTLRTATGTVISLPVQFQPKRAFVTSDNNVTGTSGAWTAFGCNAFTNPTDRASCYCQNRAAGAGLRNSAKYRAWMSQLSPSVIHARCNLSGRATLTGSFAVIITNGGTGYTSAPTITGWGVSGCSPAGYAVVSGGSVVDIVVTNPGTGCTGGGALTFTGGGGSGITSNSQSNGCNPLAADGGPWYSTLDQLVSPHMGFYSGGLTSASLLNAINKTETGAGGPANAWTATDPAGLADPADTCSNWTNTGNIRIGSASRTTQSWTRAGTATACTTYASTAGFYCFEGD